MLVSKVWLAVIAAAGLLMAGCDTRYRYACQDPANWEKPACQKPLCEVNRECPEHIFNKEISE